MTEVATQSKKGETKPKNEKPKAVLRDDYEHPMEIYLRIERFPHIWCATCGIGTVLTAFISGLEKSK